VVFGEVKEGMALIQEIEKQGTDSGKPKVPVMISDCGELK
jgi:cyclophilin family peptidyl-prolyl cis-trans isomerase